MRRLHALALLPALGLVELGFHVFFAHRAPEHEDYAQLATQLLEQKQPGVPVVVAPAWAEPLVRQAAPAAFPLTELARPDDSAFARFIEVSLLGERSPELAHHRVEKELRVGPFTLRRYSNPRPERALFDFASAVDAGAVEVFSQLEGTLVPCHADEVGRASTGGLHGHIAYPRKRYTCPGGRLVGVTLIEDAAYRPRRCVLVQPPVSGSVLLRFRAVPPSRRFVGFRGLSYFIARDDTEPAAQLSVSEAGRELGKVAVAGQDGWARFESERQAPPALVDVEVQARRPGVDVCFALEAR